MVTLYTWRTFGEGPTEVKKGYHSEGKNKAFTGQNIRFTQKDGKVLINSITNDDKVKSVKISGIDAKIKWSQTNSSLEVVMPKKKPCDFAFVLELSL